MVTAFVAGLFLGLGYFALLWWSLRQLGHWRHPGLALLLSMVIRMGLLLCGLYWLTDGDWRRLLWALAGLVLARLIATRYMRPQSTTVHQIGQGTEGSSEF